MDDIRYIHKSKCGLNDQKMNELKIDHEDEIKRAKEIFVTAHAERDSALSSLDQKKKENVELQSSIFQLSSR